jgi:hypothetical protein
VTGGWICRRNNAYKGLNELLEALGIGGQTKLILNFSLMELRADERLRKGKIEVKFGPKKGAPAAEGFAGNCDIDIAAILASSIVHQTLLQRPKRFVGLHLVLP